MTRIVAGEWGGRRLEVPNDDRVRPTAERVREAWLNILRPDLPEAKVLDLYAGSGALGLEALSRGAAHVTFVERHAPSLTAIQNNVSALGAKDRTTVQRGDALRVIAALGAGAFDIALADPPFATDDALRLCEIWAQTPFASILAVEHSPKVSLPGGETRRWGDIAVTFLRTP